TGCATWWWICWRGLRGRPLVQRGTAALDFSPALFVVPPLLLAGLRHFGGPPRLFGGRCPAQDFRQARPRVGTISFLLAKSLRGDDQDAVPRQGAAQEQDRTRQLRQAGRMADVETQLDST